MKSSLPDDNGHTPRRSLVVLRQVFTHRRVHPALLVMWGHALLCTSYGSRPRLQARPNVALCANTPPLRPAPSCTRCQARVSRRPASCALAGLRVRALMSEAPLTGCAFSFSLPTRNSHVLSMPFFTEMGLAPAVTYCAPHERSALPTGASTCHIFPLGAVCALHGLADCLARP